MSIQRKIELLAPAKNIDIAFEAINCGADAIYIGALRFGARSAAGNSIEDIQKIVGYAHKFGVKVYVTLNTIIRDEEIDEVEKLITDLYNIKVDALIIQDLGILRMKIPPIALHASTQCDITTVEKAKFLEEVGFSQLVLARELSKNEIKRISDSVSVPLESFVHGALCVSYSGRCHVSQALKGRSANRGECAQICRLPFDLIDGDGKKIITSKHLLSLKDLNQSNNINELLEAGISSLKIEGRLKDIDYVKNVVAYYRKAIDKVISDNPDRYIRSSKGNSHIVFDPQLDKSFNRGFSNYFFNGKSEEKLASFNTPKSLGEPVGEVVGIKGDKIIVNTYNLSLNNGDGISFFNEKGEYSGFRINKIEGKEISTLSPIKIPLRTKLFRTYNIQFEKVLGQKSSRYLDLNLGLIEKDDSIFINADIECNISINKQIISPRQEANTPQSENQKRILGKLGNTIFKLGNFKGLNDCFIPASILSEAKRDILVMLEQKILSEYKVDQREKENINFPFFKKELNYQDNVSNTLAKSFYISHGVDNLQIQMALEVSPTSAKENDILMTTRYCIRKELGFCKKDIKNDKLKEPLVIQSGTVKLKIEFDCKNCEMLLRKIN